MDYADNEMWKAWNQEAMRECFKVQNGDNMLPGRIAMSVGSVSTMSKDSGYTAPTKRIASDSWSGNQKHTETTVERTNGRGRQTTMSEVQASIFEPSCSQQVALEDGFWDVPMVRVTGAVMKDWCCLTLELTQSLVLQDETGHDGWNEFSITGVR